MNYTAVGTVRREKKKETGTTEQWHGQGYDPVDVGALALSFFCMYCKRVKVFYPLVVTSLEGLH